MKYSIWIKPKVIKYHWQQIAFFDTEYFFDLDKCKSLVTLMRRENPNNDLKIVQTFEQDVDF